MECVAHGGLCYVESMDLEQFRAMPNQLGFINERCNLARPELQKMIDAKMAEENYTRYEVRLKSDADLVRSEQVYGLFVFFYYEATEDNPPPACDEAIE